jgi:cytochrome c-type biogenesis protein CcsB
MGWIEMFFDISVYSFLLATVIYSIWFFWRDARSWIAGSALLGVGVASQIAFIIARGFAGGRPPFANTFETLVLFAACVGGFFLISLRSKEWKPLAPLVALATLFVTLLAHLTMQDEIEPLVPALRDNFWLTTHVLFCFVSYAAFLLAYIGAVAHLWKEERHTTGAAAAVALTVSSLLAGIVLVLLSDSQLWLKSRSATLGVAAASTVVLGLALWPLILWGGQRLGIRDRLPEHEQLEKTVYRMVALGFPFLTLGIITGSYWASQAWGHYWSWDKKEVASLITWLVFAVYLHLRLVPKWRGAWVDWVAVAGFWCVVFTYFGVNYLMSGLHAYA